MFKLKRAYVEYATDDGYRVLIDRLWPRGISKDKAHLDDWMKDIAPSASLRKWFGHKVDKWDEFREKYLEEIKNNSELVDKLRELEKEHSVVTLVYGAKDEEHNQRVVLKEFLER